jgi:hypothetical protein
LLAFQAGDPVRFFAAQPLQPLRQVVSPAARCEPCLVVSELSPLLIRHLPGLVGLCNGRLPRCFRIAAGEKYAGKEKERGCEGTGRRQVHEFKPDDGEQEPTNVENPVIALRDGCGGGFPWKAGISAVRGGARPGSGTARIAAISSATVDGLSDAAAVPVGNARNPGNVASIRHHGQEGADLK